MESKKIQVVPAIIPQSFAELKEDIEYVKKYVSTIQIDVFDGVYVDSMSWPYTVDRDIFDALVEGSEAMPGWEDISFEIDLTVDYPENVVDEWIQLGASSIIIHPRSTDVLGSIKERLTEFDVHMGVAICPSDEIREEELRFASFIQLMGSDTVGYHGVELDERVYDRARELRERYPNTDIAVDIGVNAKTAPKLIESGVNKLVSGSFIFDSMDVEEAITTLSNL